MFEMVGMTIITISENVEISLFQKPKRAFPPQ